MATKNTYKATPTQEEAAPVQESFILKNLKTIIIGVVACVAVVACVLLYNTYVVAPNNEKASTEIAVAQNNFMTERYDIALNGDSTGVKGFLAIADEYSSTDAGNLANLYAGLCYAKLGQWESAKTYIEKFNDCGDQMISPAAIGALGNVYAKLGDLDKAASTLIKAANEADNITLSPIFLVQAGEILENQGKKEEALKLYMKVKENYYGCIYYSNYRNDIEKYIQRASVK